MAKKLVEIEGVGAAYAAKLTESGVKSQEDLLVAGSTPKARKELAAELGCPAEKMGDSAQMNMWLHKTVLQKVAANGGNVPAELLD